MPQIFNANYSFVDSYKDGDIVTLTRVTADGKVLGLNMPFSTFVNAVGGGSGSEPAVETYNFENQFVTYPETIKYPNYSEPTIEDIRNAYSLSPEKIELWRQLIVLTGCLDGAHGIALNNGYDRVRGLKENLTRNEDKAVAVFNTWEATIQTAITELNGVSEDPIDLENLLAIKTAERNEELIKFENDMLDLSQLEVVYENLINSVQEDLICNPL